MHSRVPPPTGDRGTAATMSCGCGSRDVCLLYSQGRRSETLSAPGFSVWGWLAAQLVFVLSQFIRAAASFAAHPPCMSSYSTGPCLTLNLPPPLFSPFEVLVGLSGGFSRMQTVMRFDVLSLFFHLFGCSNYVAEGQAALCCASNLSLNLQHF